MKNIDVTLKFDKTTKGTHVYKDDTPNAPLRSQYISRSAVDGEPPAAIRVTVEAVK